MTGVGGIGNQGAFWPFGQAEVLPKSMSGPIEKPAEPASDDPVAEAAQRWAEAREGLENASGSDRHLHVLAERIARQQFDAAVQATHGPMPALQLSGTADPTDVALVVAELAKMPEAHRQQLADNGVTVVVCRNSVTEHLTELQGVQPRGWPPGSTWDDVPGLYAPDTQSVVIATRGHDTPEGARVPETGNGHGSTNLVLHETAHALHAIVGDPQAFLDARQADLAALSDYETQPGEAGIQETFAESYANVFGGNPDYATTHPNLYRYWTENS
ncbi:hypothetical protein LDO32_13635 [Luteimonas sp. Y-2-2-4F]|nr:hypothetical protein [Luteimonas sp. Y-2-2-4F]MCD9032768.1 hypothetical protein [Luteimonas sp. Y-2-2-4F]